MKRIRTIITQQEEFSAACAVRNEHLRVKKGDEPHSSASEKPEVSEEVSEKEVIVADAKVEYSKKPSVFDCPDTDQSLFRHFFGDFK